jgi:hypothetical protein
VSGETGTGKLKNDDDQHSITAPAAYPHVGPTLTLQNSSQWLQTEIVVRHGSTGGRKLSAGTRPWSGFAFPGLGRGVAGASGSDCSLGTTTSSKPLLELMEYDRTMEAWERQVQNRLVAAMHPVSKRMC